MNGIALAILDIPWGWQPLIAQAEEDGFAGDSPTSLISLAIIGIVLIIGFVLVLVLFNYGKLWVQALMSNATPDDQQGELQGVIAATSAVASALAPLLMTAVFWQFTHPGAPVYSPGAPFLLSAVLMLACIAILVVRPPVREVRSS